MGRSRSHSLALAIACYLVQLGCDPEVRNRKNKTCADIIADATVWETLISYIRRRNERLCLPSSPVLGGETLGNMSPLSEKEVKVPTSTVTESSLEGIECIVCCESPPNVRFEPCGHIIACVDCARRMKKCLECHLVITSKTNLGETQLSTSFSLHFLLL